MVLVTLADVISFTVSALIPHESRAVNHTNMLVTIIALNLYVAPPHPPPPLRHDRRRHVRVAPVAVVVGAVIGVGLCRAFGPGNAAVGGARRAAIVSPAAPPATRHANPQSSRRNDRHRAPRRRCRKEPPSRGDERAVVVMSGWRRLVDHAPSLRRVCVRVPPTAAHAPRLDGELRARDRAQARRLRVLPVGALADELVRLHRRRAERGALRGDELGASSQHEGAPDVRAPGRVSGGAPRFEARATEPRGREEDARAHGGGASGFVASRPKLEVVIALDTTDSSETISTSVLRFVQWSWSSARL